MWWGGWAANQIATIDSMLRFCGVALLFKIIHSVCVYREQLCLLCCSCSSRFFVQPQCIDTNKQQTKRHKQYKRALHIHNMQHQVHSPIPFSLTFRTFFCTWPHAHTTGRQYQAVLPLFFFIVFCCCFAFRNARCKMQAPNRRLPSPSLSLLPLVFCPHSLLGAHTFAR